MDALTLGGFLRVAALAGVPACGLAVGVCSALGAELLVTGNAGLAAFLNVGLLAALGVYLVQLRRDVRQLRLSPDDLLPGEEVVLQTPFSVVHYRRGRRGGVFDATGGKLVLTTRRLAFLTHRGQPWEYRLYLPLEEIERVECRPDPGMHPGELLVVLTSGEQQLFTFGMIRPGEPENWAEAIGAFGLFARLDADPPGAV